MGLQVPVIFMSGYADRSLDREILGIDSIFLQKPFSLATLAQAVRNALEDESHSVADLTVANLDCGSQESKPRVVEDQPTRRTL